jgi:hypothetical protein
VLFEIGARDSLRVFSRADGKFNRVPQPARVASKVLYKYEVSAEGVVSR